MLLFFMTTFLLACMTIHGQTVRWPLAALDHNISAYSQHVKDVQAFSFQQAALARYPTMATGIYVERRFGLAELDLYKASVALPTQAGNFGWTASYFGKSYYHESMLGLAYARTLKGLNVGMQFNYYQFRAGAIQASAVNAEGGLIMQLTPSLQTGLHVYNPYAITQNKEGWRLPWACSAGLGYDLSEKLFAGLVLRKIGGAPFDAEAGVQYGFSKKLSATAGIATGTQSFFLSTQWLYQQIRLGISMIYHPQLGLTTGLQLHYQKAKV